MALLRHVPDRIVLKALRAVRRSGRLNQPVQIIVSKILSHRIHEIGNMRHGRRGSANTLWGGFGGAEKKSKET